MGYIFEELLRKFSEMSNETAGEHYTPREVITLMVELFLGEKTSAELTQNPKPVRTVYDPAAGTGGMLMGACTRSASVTRVPWSRCMARSSTTRPGRSRSPT